MEYIENRTFDEIKIGDSASLVRTLSKNDISIFAAMSGDVNPAHVDAEYAKTDMFHKIIAHGMWGGSLISTVLGTKLPGPGAIYLGQTLKFLKPVGLGDRITVTVKVRAKDPEKHRVTLDCECANEQGDLVIAGTAEIVAPLEKVKRPRAILPEIRLGDAGARHRHLIDLANGLPPLRTAVVHPVDRNSLVGALDAAKAGLIVPVLIGPEQKIGSAAEEANVDLGPYELLPCEHSHAAAAAAVALARAGKVDAVMNGSLRTDELMREVVAKDSGLRTARRISHVFVIDVSTCPRPLFLTDAAINIAPDLDDKRDIVQNAVDLVQALGVETPRVAILSFVATVEANVRSTVDAAALCKMADRKQITGALVDGPLAFDLAVSQEAARVKEIDSAVAGRADILVVPDLESGNMLAKQLEYLAEAQCAGIVLGARVPIALTGRADTPLNRMVSCAVALLLAHHRSRSRPMYSARSSL
jgi:phosphate acetyltransferase/phosphate butyryltransferase